MTAEVPRVSLNDGHGIPQLGFGVWQVAERRMPEILGAAIESGYRLVDTASIYGNEEGVGRTLRETPVPRDDIFVTTKLWNDRQGYDETLRAFDESMDKLGLDRVDLYLIHWPCPERGLYVETWRALIQLKKQGRATSIGVSNFTVEALERVIGETGVVPAVNQIELHPGFQQRALREEHAKRSIVTQAWSPLGQGSLLADPRLNDIARRHKRTPAQIVLRWHIENGFVAIPKSGTPSRIAENIRIFDFTLDRDDHADIARLDRAGGRIGPDPSRFG